MSVELTILIDGVSTNASFVAEDGLSILVRGRGRTFLFDCGASAENLTLNSRQVGLSPSDVEGVIISHGHCDHTGGLGALASARPAGTEIFAHAGAFSRRWVDKPGASLKEISCPHALARLAEGGARMRWIGAPEMIEDWLILSGPVGGPPNGNETFVVSKGEEMVVDNFEDEIFMLLRGREGWVIVTGCCHRGLRNTMRCAKFLARGEPIVALVGGLHLKDAGKAQLDDAAEQLRQTPNIAVYPCHCTGQAAIEHLQSQFPGQIHAVGVGSKIDL